ncbi:MAG TPA: ribbon-helix-helix protein, CopG family [Bacteroidota bacterium]|nr:ribbon-helix-helix protein, CopG family [Bacteroidota bacterium]
MIRTQIYLTEEEKAGLESVALALGKKQSEIIRWAVDDLLARQVDGNRTKILDEIAGIWSAREDIPEIRTLRTGWKQRPIR